MKAKVINYFVSIILCSCTILSCSSEETRIPYSFNGVKIGDPVDSVSHIFDSTNPIQKGIFRYDIDTLLHYEVAILRNFDGEKVLANSDKNVMKESFPGPLSIRFREKKVDQISAEASPSSLKGFQLMVSKYEKLYDNPAKRTDSSCTWTKGKYLLDINLRSNYARNPVLYVLIWKNIWSK